MIGRFILDIGPERITATREDDGIVLASAHLFVGVGYWRVGNGLIDISMRCRARFHNRADACSAVIDYAKKHVMDAIAEAENG